MKKRIPILLLAALILFVAWWLLRTSARNPASAPLASPLAETERAASATTAPAAVAQPTSGEAYEVKRIAETRERGQSSNQPIRFYGKVIDQHGEPISDVKVTLGLRTFKEPAPGVMGDGFDYPIAITGADGRFELSDAKGSVLTIKSLEKLGYEASIKTVNKSYRYWAHPSEGAYRPNADAPEIFRMWKKQGAETLAVHSKMTRIPYNGTPVTFDLLTGRQVQSGGDLKITLTRSPEQIKWGQRNYDWTLTVEAVDGGVIESHEEQMFLAPAEGYQPKIVLSTPSNASDWTDEKVLTCYVKSRGGKQYARVELSVMVGSDKPTTGFSFRSFVNPSGSRNLEY